MSDSDDTDLLLLIPPDFFAVDSSESEDSSLPRRNLKYKHFKFDKLITQLNELEDRVNFIESKENITCENLSESSRINNSIDYSVLYDSCRYHNVYNRDLALRFYSLTSTGFSFGNGHDSDAQGIESSGINPSSSMTMPFKSPHLKPNSDKSFENGSCPKSYDVRNPDVDVPFPTFSRSGMETDNLSTSIPMKKGIDSNYSHLVSSAPYHNFSFLNEIDEFLESKYKENNEYVFPNLISNFKSDENKDKLSSLETREKKDIELEQVDKLLSEVEATHFRVKNKLQPPHISSMLPKSSVDYNEQKYLRDCSKINEDKSVIDGIKKVTEYVNSVPAHRSKLVEELFGRSYKTHDLAGKQCDRLLNEYKASDIGEQFTNFDSNSKGQFINSNANLLEVSSKSTVSSENKIANPSEEYAQQKSRKPNLERLCLTNNGEALNFVADKDVPSQPSDQAHSEISELRKMHCEDGENSVKNYQIFKSPEEHSLPKGSTGNFPTETVSSAHTNTESTSGHVSVHQEGRGKTTRPIVLDDGYYSSIGACSSTANLLSLSDLWTKDRKAHQGMDILSVEHKLQEERCRRKHCENVIQELQRTVLEQQQKLAVALRVDQSKDYTIHQLKSAWKRLASHWQELEEQRNSLSIQCSEEKEKYLRDTSEMMQKIKWYENEVSKALNVAHGYKEKNDSLEEKIKLQAAKFADERRALEANIAKEQMHLLNAKTNLANINDEVADTKKKIRILEENAVRDKKLAQKDEEEAKALKNALENLEIDLRVMREENSSLSLRLKEERARNEIASQQIKDLQGTLDERKKKEEYFEAELKERMSHLEKTKSDLRDYYQQQVEIVVQEKLIEFQTQLDAAEASLHQEMDQKEKLALQTASKQIKLISEKNLLEVKLLEEKHKEELNLYKLQLTQAMQQIGHLQSQLQSYSSRKVEIVEKLQNVMETQWQEALRIISGNSPVAQSLPVQHASLEKHDIFNIPMRDVNNAASNVECDNVPLLPVGRSSGSSTTDEDPFNKDDILTYRPSNEVQATESNKFEEENPDLIKKYIQMLLNRPPGNPVNEEYFNYKDSVETPVCEGRSLPKWEKVMEYQRILHNSEKESFPPSIDGVRYTNTCVKETRSNKPPWK